jgi:soluble lytic murein transglycosylase-like protein
MGTRAVSAAVIALLVAGVLIVPSTPGAAVEGPTVTDTQSELDAARRQLESSSRELAALEAMVRATADELAVLDDALLVAATELSEVETDLVAAEAAFADALEHERTAAQALVAADAGLEALLGEWEAHRQRLAARAIHTYKHGSASPQELFVRGVIGASDWHQVAVTMEVVGRVAGEDRGLVQGSAELTRATADARADVGLARVTAVAAARTAADEQRRVETLVARQTSIVTEIDTQRRQRESLLGTLEADAAARALLVADLEQRVAELELSAAAVFRPIVVDLDVYGPPPAWAAGLPAQGQRWAAAIEAIAARNGLDGRLLAAIVWTESNFRPDAVSHAGAMGLAQLMPGTARGLGVDPRDPLQNLDGGARYIRIQLERFDRVDLALAAYNAGPGRVQAAGNAVPNIVETQLYVVRVLERYRSLGA